MARTNMYGKSCNGCRTWVEPERGYITKPNGVWLTWCSKCVPERIEPTQTRRELTATGEVYTPYEPNNLPLLRAMPGAKWNPTSKCWTVSLAEADRERVLEIADKLGLSVPSDLRRTVTTQEAQNAADVAGLYPFQVKGVNFLSLGAKRLLGDEMGVGKTVQTLVALPKEAKAVAIVPACVKYNWRDECKKWRPDLTPVVLSGKDSFRPPAPGELLIINFDILPAYLTPKAKDQPAVVPDTVREALKGAILIVDEAHKVKNYKSLRSKRVRTLSGLVGKTWGLTGTPLLNRPGDLYGVLDSLGMTKEVFGSWYTFCKLYNAEKDRWGGMSWGSPSVEVPERLRRVMLRRTRQEVLPDLPTKTISTMVVNEIPASLRRKLDSLEDAWGGFLGLGDELPPFEEFSGIRAELAESRIPAVLEYVEDCEEQDIPLVVASAHRAPIDTLATRPGWGVITGDTSPEKRQEVVRRFQAGELKGVGLTIQAGGVGITLTRAWRMLFVDLDWTPANNAQCEDRICRIGQESQKVEIVRMVSDHVLDQHVLKLIASKIAMIEASVEKLASPVLPPPVKIDSETEEQYQARMDAFRKEREEREATERAEKEARIKAHAKSRVEYIRNRERQRYGTEKPVPVMTEELAGAVRRAFAHMLSVCDGAEMRDGQGFNKPDAFVAHVLLTAGLETDQELEAGYLMCSRYHRQLKSREPLLFVK